MTDDSTTETHETHEPIEVPTQPSGGSGASLADLERWKASIVREFETARTADKQEKEELRQALAQANEWIAEQKKAQEERQKARDTESTIVVPPERVLAGQPPQDERMKPGDEHHADGDQSRRKGGWKRIW